MQDILELVKAALLDENHGDPVYKLSYGIIGDLAETFGSQIKPLLLQDWVAAELKSRRCPPEDKQTMRWAREVGLFKTDRVPLNDSSFRPDGQACHSVSIVLRFFLPFGPRFFTSSLQYFLYWFNLRIREILSTLGSLYLSMRFVRRRPSSGWCPLPSLYSRPGPTIFPYIQCSFPTLLFWFESLLSIITVSFESQSSSHHYIVISRNRFPLPSRHGEWNISSSTTRLQPHVSPTGTPIHPNLSSSEPQRFDNPIPLLFSCLACSVIAWYLAIFTFLISLCSLFHKTHKASVTLFERVHHILVTYHNLGCAFRPY